MRVAVLTILLACWFVSFSWAVDAPKFQPEITFVASVEELKTAETEKDLMKGLAVNWEYYRKAPEEERKRSNALVLFLLDKSLRPVFFYGPYLRTEDIEKIKLIFGTYADGAAFGCDPAIAIGIFVGVYLDNALKGVRVLLCVTLWNEGAFREAITWAWTVKKEDIREQDRVGGGLP